MSAGNDFAVGPDQYTVRYIWIIEISLFALKRRLGAYTNSYKYNANLTQCGGLYAIRYEDVTKQ